MALTKVPLDSGISGILPVANGGTGTSTGISPAGSNNYIQYNSSGSFGASANFQYSSGQLFLLGPTAGTNVNLINFYLGGTRAAGNQYGFCFSDSAGETNAAIWVNQNGSGNNAASLIFGTNAGVGGAGGITSTTERMRITSSGYLGVGTTAPSSPITIGRVDSASEGGQIDLCRSSDNANAWGIDVYGNTTTPSLRFIDNTAAATRMQIDSSGNVKLSTASTAIQNSSGRAILNQTGSVLQVQTSVIGTAFSTTSQSAVNTTLSVSITPTNASTKILVFCGGGAFGYTNSGGSNYSFTLWRNGVTGTQFAGATINTTGSVSQLHMPGSVMGVDSPATTSSTTYYLAVNTQPGVGGTVTVREGCFIVAMEIAQ